MAVKDGNCTIHFTLLMGNNCRSWEKMFMCCLFCETANFPKIYIQNYFQPFLGCNKFNFHLFHIALDWFRKSDQASNGEITRSHTFLCFMSSMLQRQSAWLMATVVTSPTFNLASLMEMVLPLIKLPSQSSVNICFLILDL